MPIVRDSGNGRELALARWGLVPHWSKEARPKYSTINARAESVAEKPTYRESFKHKHSVAIVLPFIFLMCNPATVSSNGSNLCLTL